jgi:hypothetical protein
MIWPVIYVLWCLTAALFGVAVYFRVKTLRLRRRHQRWLEGRHRSWNEEQLRQIASHQAVCARQSEAIYNREMNRRNPREELESLFRQGINRLFHNVLAHDNAPEALQELVLAEIRHNDFRCSVGLILRARFADEHHTTWQQWIEFERQLLDELTVSGFRVGEPVRGAPELYAEMRQRREQQQTLDRLGHQIQVGTSEEAILALREVAENVRRDMMGVPQAGDRIVWRTHVAPDDVQLVASGWEDVQLVSGWEAAQRRSMELLKTHLTPEQREQLETIRAFDVIGCETGTRYRIDSRYQNYNVFAFDGGGATHALCFEPKGGLPKGDVMLTQKIYLENFEGEVRTVANKKVLPPSATREMWPA